MDPDWWRSLCITLQEPLALNLRNEYLHGRTSESTKQDATLVLLVANYLRLLEVKQRHPEAD